VAKAEREFQIFAKPSGAACNLRCGYCYYLEKEDLYPKTRSHRMSEDLLEQYIVQHIGAAPGEEIRFSWHGGEPTVLGLDYFRRIVALQRRHRPPDRRISNGIQTNGVLLDEEWCRFLAEEQFGVGLSLDGPQEMHDRYRIHQSGAPSHKQTVRAFELLRQYRIPCDILCVVNDHNVQYPGRVYRYFKEIGAEYIGFLPVVAPQPGAPGGVSSHTAPAGAYGSFLCAIFDEWVRQDVGRISVQIFDEAARPARGLDHSLCIYRETCGDIPVVEHNGDFYCCDHFVDERHRLGNILDVPLVELIESPAQRAFGNAKQERLPQYCLDCDVRPMCNGGCPKDRFVRAPDGEQGLNYLCPGLKLFFSHSLPYLIQISALEQTSQGPQSMTRVAQATVAERYPGAGRNDPCPCGSGRKYKKCCLGR
jgi:uncharacterized protein